MHAITVAEGNNAAQEGAKEAVISLKNIHKTYLLGIEGVPALRGVSVDIYRGEWVAIYGTSGGGKSSLLNVIGTIDKPTKGELKIFDTRTPKHSGYHSTSVIVINSKTTDETLANLRLNHLGFVFQSFNLIPMTACENVQLPMALKGLHSPSEQKRIATESLVQVGLGNRLNHYPTELSGGQQQRVAIARAIANRPDILLLDEPTGDLDSVNTFKVVDLLDQLNKNESKPLFAGVIQGLGMTLVMVTHDLYLKNFADRVIWMRDGKIAKIEVVPPEKRLAAQTALQAKLEQIKNKVQVASELSNVRGEAKAPPGFPESWTHTEIRNPLDYNAIAFSDFLQKEKQEKQAKKTNRQPSEEGSLSPSIQSRYTASHVRESSHFSNIFAYPSHTRNPSDSTSIDNSPVRPNHTKSVSYQGAVPSRHMSISEDKKSRILATSVQSPSIPSIETSPVTPMEAFFASSGKQPPNASVPPPKPMDVVFTIEENEATYVATDTD